MEPPDLQIHVQHQQQRTPYYDSCCPRKGFVQSTDDVSIYYEVHGWTADGLRDVDLDRIPKVLMVMGLACGCSAWRWQLQDLMAHHVLEPTQPAGTAPLQQQQQQPGTPRLQQVQPQQHSSSHVQQQQHQQQQEPYSSHLQLVNPAAQASMAASAAAAAAAAAGETVQLYPGNCSYHHHHHHQQLQHSQQQQYQPHSHQQQQGQQGQPRASPMLVCVVDNRGIGMSSSPSSSKCYTTSTMAGDVLRVMDHLHWSSAHLVGFSMGGMIATKVAALAPERIASLTLISSSAGGWQILPHSFKGLRTAARIVTARSPEAVADATLHMHFTGRTLREWVAHHRSHRRELLRKEYMAANGPPQPPCGFHGQLHACWTHSVTNRDVRTIRQAKFPLLVIHGRHDQLASPRNAEKLAARLRAPCVLLEGAHFIVRECAGQINMLLSGLVFGERHFQAIPHGPYLDPSPSLQQQWLLDSAAFISGNADRSFSSGAASTCELLGTAAAAAGKGGSGGGGRWAPASAAGAAGGAGSPSQVPLLP